MMEIGEYVKALRVGDCSNVIQVGDILELIPTPTYMYTGYMFKKHESLYSGIPKDCIRRATNKERTKALLVGESFTWVIEIGSDYWGIS